MVIQKIKFLAAINKIIITSVFTFAFFILSVAQNNSLNFTGFSNVTLQYNSALDFSITSVFSIEGWFKTTNNTAVLYSSFVDASPYRGHEIAIVNTKLVFAIVNTNLTNHIRIETVSPYNDGNWHHFACVYKGIPNASNIDIYVDGILQAQNVTANNLTSGPISSNNAIHFGSRNNTNYYLSGNLDEIRVWSKALCASEVVGRKNCELIGNEPQLLAYYNFNQGVAGGSNSMFTVLPNVVGPSPNGTLTGFSLNGATSNYVASTSSLSGTCNYSYISLAGSTSVCANNSATITASGASTYSWSNGSIGTSVVLSPSVSSVYSVSSSASNSCTGVSVFTIIVNPSPTVTAVSSSGTICVGQSATITAAGASAYVWNTSSAGGSIVVSPSVTTTYVVSGVNLANCTASTSVQLNVSPCLGSNSFAKEQNELLVFPNPASTQTKVEYHLPETTRKAELVVTNLIGQEIMRYQLIETGNASIQIDVTALANGVYSYSILADKQILQTEKMIVAH
jgi:hypothetical protein